MRAALHQVRDPARPCCGLVFALAPALRASRADVAETLKGGERHAGARARRRLTLRDGLVVSQITLSLLALVVAALFLRSVQRAYAIDLGYDRRSLAVLTISPGAGGYDRSRGEQFYRHVRQRISILPGVTAVSWSANQPLWANTYRRVFIDTAEVRDESSAPLLIVNTVDLSYFTTAGIPIVRGRGFSNIDREGALPVAIVSETMASRYWPERDPVGRHFTFGADDMVRQVIGVVKTVKYQAIGEAPQPCVYLPMRQNYSQAMVLYVRGEGDTARLLATVEREVRAIDRAVPVENVATVDEVIDQSLWMVKLGAGLLAVFGLLALGLSSVGLYGTIVYLVQQRRKELALRIALGADPARVRLLVLRQGMTLAGLGVAAGLGSVVADRSRDLVAVLRAERDGPARNCGRVARALHGGAAGDRHPGAAREPTRPACGSARVVRETGRPRSPLRVWSYTSGKSGELREIPLLRLCWSSRKSVRS